MKPGQVATARNSGPVRVSRRSLAASGTAGSAVAGLAILAAVPYFAGGPAEQPLIVAFTFIAMATMWNLLAGFSGLTSFGQNAYIGVGAYGLYLVASHGLNPFAGIAAAAVIAGLVSVPVSVLLLRRGGAATSLSRAWSWPRSSRSR